MACYNFKFNIEDMAKPGGACGRKYFETSICKIVAYENCITAFLTG